MTTVGEFVKILSKTELTENQKQFFNLLYHSPNGLTIRTLTDAMFDDGNRQRLAGVLSDISKRIAPGNSHNAYLFYLDSDGVFGDEERVSLKPEFRRAVDLMVNKPF